MNDDELILVDNNILITAYKNSDETISVSIVVDYEEIIIDLNDLIRLSTHIPAIQKYFENN